MMRELLQRLSSSVGKPIDGSSHREKLISGLGGFTAILLMLLVSAQFVGAQSASWIVFSMGASAVLLFAVPHGPLSQPWAVLVGHTVSAVVGVSAYRLIPDPLLAAAIAVGLATSAMYYLRCIHPPGGATALAAVGAGPDVHALGYAFVVTPVLLNVTVLLVVAVLFNWALPWRRYPAALTSNRDTASSNKAPASGKTLQRSTGKAPEVDGQGLSKADAAVQPMAMDEQTRGRRFEGPRLKIGACYSNGVAGAHRIVCQIVGIDRAGDRENEVVYRIVFGPGEGNTGVWSSREFARWAKCEVGFNEIAGARSETHGAAGPGPRWDGRDGPVTLGSEP